MDFALSPDQQEIRDAVLRIAAGFSGDYWLERDEDGEFPMEFHRAMAEAGWLGIAMPEGVGGAGLGITEAALMMQAVAEAAAGWRRLRAFTARCSAWSRWRVFGTEEQQAADDSADPVGRGEDVLRGD